MSHLRFSMLVLGALALLLGGPRARAQDRPQPAPWAAPQETPKGQGAAQNPTVLWTRDTKAPSYGSGAIADIDGDGKPEVVFGTYFNDAHLYALNAEDGSVLWKHKSDGGPLDASVAIADLDGDGTLEVVSADSARGTLYVLTGKTGALAWKFALPSGTDSPPAIADLSGDGSLEIVVGTMVADRQRRGRVVAIDARTHKAVWTAIVPGHVQSEPALVDLTGDGVLDVLVTTWRGDDRVRALDGRTGQELWTYRIGGNSYHGVTVIPHKGTRRLVVASTKGDLTLLSVRGKPLWTRKLEGSLFAPTAAADLDGDGVPEIIAVTDRLAVFALDGTRRYVTAKQPGHIARGVAIGDCDGDGDLDLVFGAGRTLVIADGSTGATVATYDATVRGVPWERIDHAPLIADLDGDGDLDVFFVIGKGTSDRTRPDNFGRAVALSVGTSKGARAWTTFRGNLRRTGMTSPPVRPQALPRVRPDAAREDF